ncbi:hypothetical protein F9C11_19815 [Amycolatopsis sp. VS8301801F10]|uniref:hypothetical protein n=1 Tax=Amycolatopsis sp. VS8301801F10 TaxID=2652442 RepID=UPI0038FD0262
MLGAFDLEDVPVGARLLPTAMAEAAADRRPFYHRMILAEGTRILAAQEVPRVRAATAFRHAGYVNFERAITMAWQ